MVKSSLKCVNLKQVYTLKIRFLIDVASPKKIEILSGNPNNLVNGLHTVNIRNVIPCTVNWSTTEENYCIKVLKYVQS